MNHLLVNHHKHPLRLLYLLLVWPASYANADNIVLAPPVPSAPSTLPMIDYNNTVKRLLPLATAGNSSAQFNLAVSYEYLKQYTNAFYWYTQASNAGNTDAKTNLGMLYHDGMGVEKNQNKAKELFLQAATSGNDKAQTNLGVMLSAADGDKRDVSEAIKWYKKAAMQGNAMAQSNLGYMFYKGIGVPADQVTAFKLFSKAAIQKHPIALYNLGLMYSLGHGVTQNKIYACMWWQIAAQNGDKDAGAKLALVMDNLSPDETAQVTQLVQAWRQQYSQAMHNK